MVQILLSLVLAATGLFSTSAVHAETEIRCTVRSVHDGDSMRVQCRGERRTTAIRMRQIDAPELDQAHGIQARDHLRKLCSRGSTATIRTQGRDQYGRVLGDVYCANKNINEEMVSSGSAWPYRRYVTDQKLFRLQKEAREARRGLWGGKNPQEPWRWRYEQRN